MTLARSLTRSWATVLLAHHAGCPLQDRELVLLLTITVIVVTLNAQGFTLAPLVGQRGAPRRGSP
ncbi:MULTISPECIES: hypothetical protein [Frankia]|uniref:hypothetical protein n=1 Tax=Frankia TaxID=1854 RepID=UPI000FF88B11|nr:MULTISPECIES: hypothetical protein [Frankia]